MAIEMKETSTSPTSVSPAEKNGRPSIINDYCLRAIENGHTKCILICVRRGRRWFAKDIRLIDIQGSFGIYELRRLSGWWKRHSLYSVIGVREVLIRFVGFEKLKKEIEVAKLQFPHDSSFKKWGDFWPKAWDKVMDIESCIVNINGEIDHDNCHNEFQDRLGNFYRSVQEGYSSKIRQEKVKWLPSMLEFYWQRGIDEEGWSFLDGAGFIKSYEHVAYDIRADAMQEYGKEVEAFELVEGWHIRYLLCLIASSFLISICIIALATIVNHNFDAGMTAGSYALGLTTGLLGLLTFLSAVF